MREGTGGITGSVASNEASLTGLTLSRASFATGLAASFTACLATVGMDVGVGEAARLATTRFSERVSRRLFHSFATMLAADSPPAAFQSGGRTAPALSMRA